MRNIQSPVLVCSRERSLAALVVNTEKIFYGVNSSPVIHGLGLPMKLIEATSQEASTSSAE